jgi:hypothetical protein
MRAATVDMGCVAWANLDSDLNPAGFILAPGYALDAGTGLLSWSPTALSPAQVTVVARVYDHRAGYATQAFAIDVAGGNIAPVVAEREPEYTLREGEPFEIGLSRKRRNNTSGIVGDARYAIRERSRSGRKIIQREFWQALADDGTGGRRSRKLSLAKYGEARAKWLAVRARRAMLREVGGAGR